MERDCRVESPCGSTRWPSGISGHGVCKPCVRATRAGQPILSNRSAPSRQMSCPWLCVPDGFIHGFWACVVVRKFVFVRLVFGWCNSLLFSIRCGFNPYRERSAKRTMSSAFGALASKPRTACTRRVLVQFVSGAFSAFVASARFSASALWNRPATHFFTTCGAFCLRRSALLGGGLRLLPHG